MSSWTQPVCDECWAKENPDRVPVRLIHPERERCCMCGKATTSGIYVRKHPATVPYPTEEDS